MLSLLKRFFIVMGIISLLALSSCTVPVENEYDLGATLLYELPWEGYYGRVVTVHTDDSILYVVEDTSSDTEGKFKLYTYDIDSGKPVESHEIVFEDDYYTSSYSNFSSDTFHAGITDEHIVIFYCCNENNPKYGGKQFIITYTLNGLVEESRIEYSIDLGTFGCFYGDKVFRVYDEFSMFIDGYVYLLHGDGTYELIGRDYTGWLYSRAQDCIYLNKSYFVVDETGSLIVFNKDGILDSYEVNNYDKDFGLAYSKPDHFLFLTHNHSCASPTGLTLFRVNTRLIGSFSCTPLSARGIFPIVFTTSKYLIFTKRGSVVEVYRISL